MADPLFISGTITKNKNNEYKLDVFCFEEYFSKKHQLKYLADETSFFKYNGQCYEYINKDTLNAECQKELGRKRKLFTTKDLSSFEHHCIGDPQCILSNANQDQVKYLTLQNGLFDLDQGVLVHHSPDTFTTNLLPYDYDELAQCPLWLKYLDDVFMGDQDKIMFAQEAIGYVFLKQIPTPALFFLKGTGSNGKSVFINTITNLFGEENVASISLGSFSKEYYTLGLFGKMANISGEAPNKFLSTDVVKAIVSGDWVQGRDPYKRPTKFRPYAKHFIAMNEEPATDDNSYGWWRRIYVLKFERTFHKHEMDVFLTDKLKNELSGIFNWAIAGYHRLKENGYILHTGESLEQAKYNYQCQNNNVISFIKKKCAKAQATDNYILFKDLYHLYCAYCESNGADVLSKKDFRKTLENSGYKVDNNTKASNSLCVYGIALL